VRDEATYSTISPAPRRVPFGSAMILFNTSWSSGSLCAAVSKVVLIRCALERLECFVGHRNGRSGRAKPALGAVLIRVGLLSASPAAPHVRSMSCFGSIAADGTVHWRRLVGTGLLPGHSPRRGRTVPVSKLRTAFPGRPLGSSRLAAAEAAAGTAHSRQQDQPFSTSL